MLHPWLALTFQAARLTWEAQGAIAFRLTELADGGAAAQSKAMSAERVATSAEAQPVAATTAVATTAVPKDRNGASAGKKVSNAPKPTSEGLRGDFLIAAAGFGKSLDEMLHRAHLLIIELVKAWLCCRLGSGDASEITEHAALGIGLRSKREPLKPALRYRSASLQRNDQLLFREKWFPPLLNSPELSNVC
jgi:hypothetical protein